MEPTFTFRNLDASESLKEHTRQKILKLDKYLLKPIAAHVILSIDRHEHKAEITLVDMGHEYVSIERSTDMMASIDSAVHKIESQLRKAKDKIKNHHKP
ncbi:MAG: ribosomal subunit interface protein [Deltaproteobacteria bacterium CG11_big_fil_rev_8_21_14_0_20_47_16]|nr:MAG: ribosomal subunit interface protein [Deltaproteobacteria bacterium CG11_big_fil_rev_8_21_14_0_20_47_16]